MNQIPDIPAAASLQNLEFYSKEKFICADLGCAARCKHELIRNQRRKWIGINDFS